MEQMVCKKCGEQMEPMYEHYDSFCKENLKEDGLEVEQERELTGRGVRQALLQDRRLCP